MPKSHWRIVVTAFFIAGLFLLSGDGNVGAADDRPGIGVFIPIPGTGHHDDGNNDEDDYDDDTGLGIGVTIPIGNNRDDAANAAEEMICGPNITPNVTDVMGLMVERFDGWTEDEQKARCKALLDLKTAGYAWDIHQLSPEIGRAHV